MDIMERIKEWESSRGVDTFLAMGVREGSRVMDFGFGQGHFSVAAANAVGSSGWVYALDCGLVSVETLSGRVEREGIVNISVIHTCGGVVIDTADDSIDCMLLYDILHYEELDKAGLVAEAHRVLAPGGILSIIPFHMGAEAVGLLIQEIIDLGFTAPELLPDAGLHCGMLYKAYEENQAADFDNIGKGTIYNFKKELTR